MADISPELNREIRIFDKAFSKEYLEKLRRFFEGNSEACEFRKLKSFFMEDAMSEEWADRLISICEEAVQAYNGKNKEKPHYNITVSQYLIKDTQNLPVQKFKSEYEEQMKKATGIITQYEKTKETWERLKEYYNEEISEKKNEIENSRKIIEKKDKALQDKDAAIDRYRKIVNENNQKFRGYVENIEQITITNINSRKAIKEIKQLMVNIKMWLAY